MVQVAAKMNMKVNEILDVLINGQISYVFSFFKLYIFRINELSEYCTKLNDFQQQRKKYKKEKFMNIYIQS